MPQEFAVDPARHLDPSCRTTVELVLLLLLLLLQYGLTITLPQCCLRTPFLGPAGATLDCPVPSFSVLRGLRALPPLRHLSTIVGPYQAIAKAR